MLTRIISEILAVLFHFIPRDKHLWVTGKVSPFGYDTDMPLFFDNSKYLYLYLVHNTDEKVYWITSSQKEIELLESMGLPVVKFKTLKGIFLTLRAKYSFHHYGIDQIKKELQLGSIQLDLWHGTPLKKIRYDVVPKVDEKESAICKFLNKGAAEYVSSTSKYLSEKVLQNAFQVSADKMLNCGYPRMDVMKLSKEETIKFCEKYSTELLEYIATAQKHKRVFLYMPTWRDDDPEYFKKANIDFEKMNKRLKDIDGVLFLKLHPLTKYVEVNDFDNIIQLRNDVDIYPFLTFTDCLITDYSSIYFDYLPLDKEIIFIPYDYDNYVRNRALYFEYNEVTPGKKYMSFDAFVEDLDKFDTIDYSEQRKKVSELFIENYNFDACENIYKYMVNKK